MDAERFDRIAKALSGGADRRRLLIGLLGGALTGLLRQPAAADDTPKPAGKKCNKDEQCQFGSCCRAEGAKHGTCGACCGNADCDPCQECVSGQCQSVANNTVACDGSALQANGCTRDTVEIGVCVNGACSCGPHDYVQATNRCRCNATAATECAALCCRVGQVCTNGITGTGCIDCS